MSEKTPYEYPVGFRTVNPLLIDARRNNNLQENYTDIAEVLLQNPLAVRKEGQVFNVSTGGSGFNEYWFRFGIQDSDLELRGSDGGLKVVDDISDITEANVGEHYYVVATESVYTIKEKPKFLRVDKDLGASRSIGLYGGDNDWPGGFQIGDKWRINVKLDVVQPIGNNYIIQFDNTNGLRIFDGDKVRQIGGVMSFELLDENGNIALIPPATGYRIPHGKWVVLQGTFTANVTNRTQVFAPLNKAEFLQDGSSLDVKWIEIEKAGITDHFNVTTWDGTSIYNSDKTKTFTNAVSLNDEGVTLQTPVVDFVNPLDILEIPVPGNLVAILNVAADNKVSPQMLGYNASNIGYLDENYANDLINSIELSKYSLYLPSGMYALDESIELHSPQSHYWSGGELDYNDRGQAYFDYELMNRTIFYTHKDIDIFKIFSSGVNITGGTYDVRRVPFSPTKRAIFRMCYRDNNILGSTITNAHMVGELLVTKEEGGGHVGVLLDTSTVNPRGDRPDGGEFHFNTFDFYGEYLDIGYLATDDSTINPDGTKVSVMNDVKVRAWKCKQAVVLDGMEGQSNFDVWFQANPLLTLNELNDEKKNTAIYINQSKCEVRMHLIDMGFGDLDGDRYRQIYGLTVAGIQLTFLSDWNTNEPFINQVVPIQPSDVPYINPKGLRILPGGTSFAGFIGSVDNLALKAVEKGLQYTYTSYENIGGNFDFKAEQDEASGSGDASSNANITVTDPENIFVSGYTPLTLLTYGPGFNDANDDFIEIVLTGFAALSTEQFKSSIAGIMSQTASARAQPRKIQVIVRADDGASFSTLSDVYVASSTRAWYETYVKDSQTYTATEKIIIRIIGNTDTRPIGIGNLYFDSTRYTEAASPIINVGGGQKIFGPLTAERLVTEELDPTAPGDVVPLAYLEDTIQHNASSTIALKSAPFDALPLGARVKTFGYREGSDLGGGDFLVIEAEAKKDLQIASTAQYISGPALEDLAVGTEVIIRFRANNLNGGGSRTLFHTTGTQQMRIFLSEDVVAGKGDFRVAPVGNQYGTFNYVRELYGDDVDFDNLFFGVWYELSILAGTASTVTSFNVGAGLGVYAGVNIESFEIAGEKWLMQEGGGTAITSDLLTECALAGSPAWGDQDLDNEFNLIKSGDRLYKKAIYNNTVTPMDYGAFDTGDVTDYTTFDSTAAIQAAIDSKYDVTVPPVKLYISAALWINKPRDFTMTGIFKAQLEDSAKDWNIDEIKTTTVIYIDQNINVFNINSNNVKLLGGLVWTAGVSMYTGSVFRLEGNARIWTCKVTSSCFGNRDDLLTTGIGGVGFHADTSNISKGGYFEDIEFGGYAYYYAKAVYVPSYDNQDKLDYGCFHNNWNIVVQGFGCKTYIWIESSIVTLAKIHQDQPVLNLEESGLPGIYFRGGDSNLTEFFIFDSNSKDDEIALGKYRHSINAYNVKAHTLTIGGVMARQYQQNAINTGGGLLQSTQSVENPGGLYISDHYGNISTLTNAIQFAGSFDNRVSYKGYKAPDAAWFENNLYGAEDVLNPTPLVENTTDISIVNPDYLLITGPLHNALIRQTVLDNPGYEEVFGEIVISDIHTLQAISSSKMELLYITCGWEYATMQTIVHFDTGIWTNTEESINGISNYKLMRNVGEWKEQRVQKIIIRIIGARTFDNCNVNDIVLRIQYQRNLPFIQSAGNQRIWGGLLAAEGFNVKRADGSHAGSIIPSDSDIFGFAVGGVDEELNPTNMLLFGSNIYSGPHSHYIASDNAIPHGYRKLGGTPVDGPNGEKFYPETFQQVEQELHAEEFTDANDYLLTSSWQTILTSTPTANAYAPPGDFQWLFKVEETGNNATEIELRFLVDAVPTTGTYFYNITRTTAVTLTGAVQLIASAVPGVVITMEVRALDTGSGRATYIRGLETPTQIEVRQLGFGTVSQTAASVSGGVYTTKQIGRTLIIYLTTSGASYTISEISTWETTEVFVKFENRSGGNVTLLPTGSDTIEGETSLTLEDKETIELHAYGTDLIL